DLMTHDLTPSAVIGADGDMVSAPRLDNQGTCYAGMEAFLAASESGPRRHVPVLVLFDHEEVGSTSDHGAQSELLLTVLERITLAAGGGREDFLRRLPGSMVASGDMAHATHPNYPERHEPGHLIEVNGGPVLKVQPNLRYATDGRTAAAFALACAQAGVPLQRYEHRADLPCGSTIGPMTAPRSWPCTLRVSSWVPTTWRPIPAHCRHFCHRADSDLLGEWLIGRSQHGRGATLSYPLLSLWMTLCHRSDQSEY